MENTQRLRSLQCFEIAFNVESRGNALAVKVQTCSIQKCEGLTRETESSILYFINCWLRETSQVCCHGRTWKAGAALALRSVAGRAGCSLERWWNGVWASSLCAMELTSLLLLSLVAVTWSRLGGQGPGVNVWGRYF